MPMFTRILSASSFMLSLLLSDLAYADIPIEKKAELIAEVINSTSQKTDKDITLTKASSIDNQVVIELEANRPAFKKMSEDDFQKLMPAFSKGFATAVCEDKKQRDFISGGGKIRYSMKIASTTWQVDTEVNQCESPSH